MNDRNDPKPDTTKQEDFTLNELTEAAGISARTVRYYIAEGLLPPPAVAGPRSSYSRAHLNRLLLIGKLKDAFWPLREIRRHLDGMSDSTIELMLHRTSDMPQSSADAPDDELKEDASAYISAVLDQLPTRRNPAPASSHSLYGHYAPYSEKRFEMIEPSQASATELHQESDDNALEGAAWRRIELGPDAELLIREDAYVRKRDRVEWLVNWAKRVFT
jgi:DNA-binding transcriptional MerR regulator